MTDEGHAGERREERRSRGQARAARPSRGEADKRGAPAQSRERPPFARPENEDDDGYDPWSDRPPRQEPLFERDPWG